MRIDFVELDRFRNLAPATVELGPGVIRVVGPNGHGKSNLLEAVHVLAQGWSPRARRGAEWIAWGEEGLLIRAEGVANDGAPRRSAVQLESRGAQRRVRLDGRESAGFSLLLGAWPLVSFGPGDVELVQGEPEARRTWMDATISQYSAEGRDRLRRYRRALRQRNGYLKGFVAPDPELKAALDAELCAEGAEVVRLRRGFLRALAPVVRRLYASVSRGAEEADLVYRCSWGEEEGADAFAAKLDSLARRESEAGATLVGPHRDDLEILLSGHPARSTASRGQQRSLTLALQLACAEFLEELFGEPPILLLDDIFSELDAGRRAAVGELLRRSGQVILAAPELSDIPFDADRTYRVESGRLTEAK